MGEVAQTASCEDLQARIENAKQELEHAKRTRRTFWRTSAAAALVRIEVDLKYLHPPASDADPMAEYARSVRMRDERFARIYKALFGTGQRVVVVDEKGSSGEIAGTADVAPMRKDMKRIYEEIRRRLGAERSLVAVFERYRQRCQWYEAERLQEVADHGPGPGGPEDRLTETLATYLFDHGLNPLTRPLAGRLQPDLLGLDDPFSFYVEAKQYTQACRTYLLDGMKQVWDMLDQLRNTGFDVAEAFYVVYRRRGPRYVFREPLVRHGDRVIHLLMIDLAPSAERGSHAERSHVFETSDLVPQPAAAADG